MTTSATNYNVDLSGLIERASDPDSLLSQLVGAALEIGTMKNDADMSCDALSFAAGTFIRHGVSAEEFATAAAMAWAEMSTAAAIATEWAAEVETGEDDDFGFDSEGNYFDRESEVA